MFTRFVFLLSLFMSASSPATAEQSVTSAGRILFEAPKLGTVGKSCSACHPAGKGLEQIGDFSDDELRDIINACVRDAQKGSLLPPDSPDLTALLRYIRTFQK